MSTGSRNRPTAAILLAVGLLVLVLASCSGSGPGDDSGSGAARRGGDAEPPGGWSFTDDRGETITLGATPEVIAADAASAGGLWEYGVAVTGGVFGEVTRADGTPGPAIGLADPDDFTSVGDSTRLNIEALAARRPDVIVATMWTEDLYYGIDETQIDEVEQIAPIIGLRVDSRSVTEPLARIAELAQSLGPDAAAEVTAARAGFDDASERFRAANAAQPDLLVMAASGSPTEMYVAYPPAWPDLRYFQELGMNLVEPEDHPTADGFWETLSWEEAAKYPADLILADARGGDIEDIISQIPGAVLSLPPIAAGQMTPWPAVHAYGYGNFAQILDDLATAVAAADPTLGDAAG